MDIHIVLAERHYAVRHDDRITITQFGIFVHQILLGFLVLALYELLATEPAADVLLLVHLLEHAFLDETTLYLLLCQVVVSADVDMMNLHLILLLHIDIQYDLVGCTGILTLGDVYHSILVALVLIIPGTQNLGTVYGVGRHLHTFEQTQLGLHILTLRLLQTDVVDGRHARTHLQIDVQIDFVCYQRVGIDFHLREEAVLPVALHGVGNLRAGDVYLLTHGESGDAGEHVVLIVVHARHVDTADGHRAGRTGITYLRIYNLVLCLHGGCPQEGGHHQQYLIYIHFHPSFHFLLVLRSCHICADAADSSVWRGAGRLR